MLFDAAILEMKEKGIPLSELDKILDAKALEAEEEEKRLAATKKKAGKVKPRAKAKKSKSPPTKNKRSST